MWIATSESLMEARGQRTQCTLVRNLGHCLYNDPDMRYALAQLTKPFSECWSTFRYCIYFGQLLHRQHSGTFPARSYMTVELYYCPLLDMPHFNFQ